MKGKYITQDSYFYNTLPLLLSEALLLLARPAKISDPLKKLFLYYLKYKFLQIAP
jgi:hypothetical protein